MTTQRKFALVFISIMAAGLLFAQSRATTFNSILIKSRDSLDKALKIHLISGQTTDAFELENSSSVIIAKMDYLGNLTAPIAPQTVTSGTAPIHFYDAAGPPIVTTTGTDTAGVATTTWVNEVLIPNSATITGISYLIGSVGGTDKVVVVLFDSAGNVLATSALAGATVGTTATFQRVAFTAPYSAVGPARYFIGVSTNGTTAKLRTQAFGDNSAGTITGGTFGTVVAITPPTTFTASQGPIAMLY